jgi:hypothetical protein
MVSFAIVFLGEGYVKKVVNGRLGRMKELESPR